MRFAGALIVLGAIAVSRAPRAQAATLAQIGVTKMRHADDVTIHSSNNANVDKRIDEGRRAEVKPR